MAALIGQRGQRNLDVLYDASGTITTGGTASAYNVTGGGLTNANLTGAQLQGVIMYNV